MHYERKGRGVEALERDAKLLGCRVELSVQSPKRNLVEQGCGEQVGVDPTDAPSPQGGPFDEAEDLTVLSEAGSPQSSKMAERLGPRRDNAQRELTEDEGM